MNNLNFIVWNVIGRVAVASVRLTSRNRTGRWKTLKTKGSRATRAWPTLLPLLFILMLPGVLQAQFNYVTNDNGTITITGGSGGCPAVR